MKKIGIALIVLVLLIGGGVYYLLTNLPGLIKSGIERYGSEATQASVRVDKVTLSLADGAGQLSGLKIGNPKGFSSEDALDLGSIGLKIDPHSIPGSGPIEIREVAIDGPNVRYEHTLGGGNLETLKRNVADYAAKNAGSHENAPATGDKPKDSERKIIIDDLYIRNGKVGIYDPALQGALSADLPTIHLSNIGRGSGGATQAQVAEQIINAITNSAVQVGAGALTTNLGSMAGKLGGKDAASKGTGALKSLFGH